ncbi:MAG: class I SAM-dependent methyltransferase [Caldilineaceae bacterium]|nr:class I SAM-dependent methyltransferase [Caldilineaceae bacterium]
MTIAGNVRSEDQLDVPVIDYENSQYKTDFWEGQGRDYEDAAERIAIRRLLPQHGVRIAEIGAGFGRLADLYLGYEQIILFDYSRTLLEDAVSRWGHDPRFVFVAGNLYQLPLATGCLDSLVMIRVMHHLADIPQALQQLERVLHKRSVAVLEYANKRNLKAMTRWLLRRQSWSPFTPTPLEFVALNFDFHPKWMNEQMTKSGLVRQQQLAVSHFRLPFLKQRVNPTHLAQIDSVFFRLGGHYPLAPSVFVQATSNQGRVPQAITGNGTAIAELFCCPQCRAEAFQLVTEGQLLCRQCNAAYAKKNGIWDFKAQNDSL